MKIVVVGLGSMGQRRIRLLQQQNTHSVEILGVDSDISRTKTVAEKYAITTFSVLSEALNTVPDVVFVCTSPLSHCSIIRDSLNANCHVFSEINLISDGYKQNIELAKSKKLLLFLSSTLMYRREVSTIKNAVQCAKHGVNFIYHSGQFLPDWHPWESYKDFFVGDKRTNGCREIMAIELPWLIDVFGTITEIKSIKGNITDLEIDFPDFITAIVKHGENRSGVFCADIASSKPARRLEVFGDSIYILWDGSPDGLYIRDIENGKMNRVNLYEKTDRLALNNPTIIEDAYMEEIDDFFSCLINRTEQRYDFERDFATLDLIDRIESGNCNSDEKLQE